MEVDPRRTSRALSFGLVVLGLVAISAGLIAMLVITTQAAGTTTEPRTKNLLAHLAWLSLALLSLTLVLLVWAVMRHVRYWLRPVRRARSSQYVDAWALAGKRIKVPEDEDSDDDRPDGDDDDRDDEPAGPPPDDRRT